MNRLTAWIKTVVVGYRRDLTDAQLAGDACALCGGEFTDPGRRADFGWIGLPFRRRAYACRYACTIDTVDDTTALFRSAIPARQDVWNWYLGVDDNPLTTDDDGRDVLDREYAARFDAQSHAVVEIVHADGILTTRPLPQEYAEKIAAQAQWLGFTAMIDDEVKAAAAAANPYASPESRAESARDAIGRFQAWSRLSRALGGNDKQVPALAEVVDITNSICPGIDLTADEAQAAIDQAHARLEHPLAVATAVITPDGPGTVIGASAKVLKVTLDDGRTRNCPMAFVKPRDEDAR